jgi:dihydrofolate reductase
MAKIIVANIMSLDGCYEGAGKNVMMMPMDAAFDDFNLEHMKQASTILLGENSYKFFGGFWPLMADNPEASPTNREFSRLYNRIDKVVASDKLKPADFPDAWKDTTSVVAKGDYASLEKLKQESGGDIVIFASRILWNDLLAHGLVDELHFVVGNVVLGKDATPMFDKTITYDDKSTTLELLDSAKAEGSNNLVVRYKVNSKTA